MNYTHYPWPDIDNFYNMRKGSKDYFNLYTKNHIEYNAKIKLHGQNAAIVITDKLIYAQSRSTILVLGQGNSLNGFTEYVASTKDHWEKLVDDKYNIIIYGEWCGLGIQKGAAICKINTKIFAIFSVMYVNKDNPNEILLFETNPFGIAKLIDYQNIDSTQTYIIPWYFEQNVKIPNHILDESFDDTLNSINQTIEKINIVDPWVLEKFGVEGVGEGLVFYPRGLSATHCPKRVFEYFAFKAKGEAHKIVSKTKAIQANAPEFESLNEFAKSVLTLGRLEQGTIQINQKEFDYKNIGKFIGWICGDVKKECQAEIEVSKLVEKDVLRVCGEHAKIWYINMINASIRSECS